MWVDFDGEHILTSSPKASFKSRAFRQQPHVAVSVVDHADPRRRLSVSGRVAQILDNEGLAFINKLSQRYVGGPYPRKAPREIFVITPDRVRVFGYAWALAGSFDILRPTGIKSRARWMWTAVVESGCREALMRGLNPAAEAASSHWRDRPVYETGCAMIGTDFLAALGALDHRLQSDGRARVTQAIREVVIDCLSPQAREALSPDERAWLRQAIEGPVGDATGAALSTLLLGLSRMVDSAPPALVAKLQVFEADQPEPHSDRR